MTDLNGLGQTLRIVLAPLQRSTDHFIFIGAGDVPQEAL
jgi:hypothetical protein